MFESAKQPARRAGSRRHASYTRSAHPQKQLALFDSRELLLSLQAPEPNPLENHGEVFTRRWVVELILDLVGYDPSENLAELVAVEPACGHGAFLLPLVERLVQSCEKHGRAISKARQAIRAFDLLPANVEAARSSVIELLLRHDIGRTTATRLAKHWISQGDFILQNHGEMSADFVLGNPPYIRLEDIPDVRSDAYRASCTTMGGRADIFVGFYEVGLRQLKPGGRLAYICADRWMRNAYGKDLRALVSAEYSVDVAISMHDVDAFEEQVAAYPAITVIRAGDQGRTIIADTTAKFDEQEAVSFREWFRSGTAEPLHSNAISAAWLGHWFTTQSGWPTGSPDRLALVARLEERFPLLEETGAKVGIGLASGADEIYITKDASVAEPSRMLPMVMRGDLQSGTVQWSGHYLVNPWSASGLVKLAEWPRLESYFKRHWPTLSARNVCKRNPGREYRTIDRVIEGLQQRRKLLLADLSHQIWPVLDEGEYYPHHNLYWIHEDKSDWDLEVLGGLLLSDIAELFISTYCVRMRGGTLRFQAQYLRRIRVPHFETIDTDDRELLRTAFKERNPTAATEVAQRLYGVVAIPR